MRYDCTEPGFENCWVEFSDAWTRKDMREFWADLETPEQVAGWLALVQRKITGCHLATTEGDAITSGADITEQAMDERMDMRLYSWLQSVLIKAATDVAILGKAAGRRLFVTPETNSADRPNPS